MSARPKYAKTTDEEGQTHVHLFHPHMDTGVCGCDLSADALVHRKPPRVLRGSKHHVDCPGCQDIINCVHSHLEINFR